MAKKSAKTRIENEKTRLEAYFEDIPENKRAVAAGLINNAAFMYVTLQDLQDEIAKKGCVETYQNGANQSGLKESTEIRVYNSLVRNYQNAISKLLDLLPNDSASRTDEFSDFLNKKK